MKIVRLSLHFTNILSLSQTAVYHMKSQLMPLTEELNLCRRLPVTPKTRWPDFRILNTKQLQSKKVILMKKYWNYMISVAYKVSIIWLNVSRE